jgi:nicotinate-nucleotide pyrophosphorylase (carboxylating)
MSISDNELQPVIEQNVSVAIEEDIGDGDLTASLLPADSMIRATVMTREPMIMAGRPWFDEVYRQIDARVKVEWSGSDGDRFQPGDTLCRLRGNARAIVSGERCALNFLQLLSATASTVAAYVAAVRDYDTRILDTRKTIPGLRLAQKYAVRCGGGTNHRFGLFDAILIKENHIHACGGIVPAVAAARKLYQDMPVEIEVESIEELREALSAKVERVLLDNFARDDLVKAVRLNKQEGDPPAALEVSGGVTLEGIEKIANTGVDYISIGALTKNIRSIDLSMRFDVEQAS